MRWTFLVVCLAGCIEASAVPCGDLLCPVGTTCIAGETCVPDEAVGACGGLTAGTACQLADGRVGICDRGYCATGVCGDGVLDGTEQCDGDDVPVTCADQGFYASGIRPGCTAQCTLDTSGCGARCGDGAIDPQFGETCDPASSEVATCKSRGFDVGRTGCTAACSRETSGCTTFGWQRIDSEPAADLAIRGDRILIVGDTDSQYAGRAWALVNTVRVMADPVTTFRAATGDSQRGYAIGDTALAIWDGLQWTIEGSVPWMTPPVGAWASDSGLWVVADGTLYERSGGVWSVALSGVTDLLGVTGTDAASGMETVWAWSATTVYQRGSSVWGAMTTSLLGLTQNETIHDVATSVITTPTGVGIRFGSVIRAGSAFYLAINDGEIASDHTLHPSTIIAGGGGDLVALTDTMIRLRPYPAFDTVGEQLVGFASDDLGLPAASANRINHVASDAAGNLLASVRRTQTQPGGVYAISTSTWQLANLPPSTSTAAHLGAFGQRVAFGTISAGDRYEAIPGPAASQLDVTMHGATAVAISASTLREYRCTWSDGTEDPIPHVQTRLAPAVHDPSLPDVVAAHVLPPSGGTAAPPALAAWSGSEPDLGVATATGDLMDLESVSVLAGHRVQTCALQAPIVTLDADRAFTRGSVARDGTLLAFGDRVFVFHDGVQPVVREIERTLLRLEDAPSGKLYAIAAGTNAETWSVLAIARDGTFEELWTTSSELTDLWVSPSETLYVTARDGTVRSGAPSALAAAPAISLGASELVAVTGTSDHDVIVAGRWPEFDDYEGLAWFDGTGWSPLRPHDRRFRITDIAASTKTLLAVGRDHLEQPVAVEVARVAGW